MMYDDDQMLMLSGIQHYMYCPRQWALIHIEQQWDENRWQRKIDTLGRTTSFDPTEALII